MVSVFDGQLTRTWFYNLSNRKHVITLYHDTITGLRSAMVDFQEIRGSQGTSSVLMEGKGHRVYFTVEEVPGYIEIKRSGWTGFEYSCIMRDRKIPESTEKPPKGPELFYKLQITGTLLTPDELSEYPVTWYIVKATRMEDNVTTSVHRRFKEFAELNSQIKQNLKGNHLRELLPSLPEKPSKTWTDHRDVQFIEDRKIKLELYLNALLTIPYVSEMICLKAFLGLMEQVKEFSVAFFVPTLGLSLLPLGQGEQATPAIIGSIQRPELCEGILVGDSISKINGLPVAGSNFQSVITRIKNLPRPVLVHFIQLISHEKEQQQVSAARSLAIATTIYGRKGALGVPAGGGEDLEAEEIAEDGVLNVFEDVQTTGDTFGSTGTSVGDHGNGNSNGEEDQEIEYWNMYTNTSTSIGHATGHGKEKENKEKEQEQRERQKQMHRKSIFDDPVSNDSVGTVANTNANANADVSANHSSNVNGVNGGLSKHLAFLITPPVASSNTHNVDNSNSVGVEDALANANVNKSATSESSSSSSAIVITNRDNLHDLSSFTSTENNSHSRAGSPELSNNTNNTATAVATSSIFASLPSLTSKPHTTNTANAVTDDLLSFDFDTVSNHDHHNKAVADDLADLLPLTANPHIANPIAPSTSANPIPTTTNPHVSSNANTAANAISLMFDPSELLDVMPTTTTDNNVVPVTDPTHSVPSTIIPVASLPSKKKIPVINDDIVTEDVYQPGVPLGWD